MNQKKIHATTLVILMITSCLATVMPALAEIGNFHAVKGAVYFNGVAAPADTKINLVFTTENLTKKTFTLDNRGYNYVINFPGHEGETGTFLVFYNGDYLTPADNKTVEIQSNVIRYHRNLHIITSENMPPTADAGGPYQAQVNTPITFSGSGSYDPDGSIVGYRWDCGDGTLTDWLTIPTATHTYTNIGTYIVKLEVKDNGGKTDNGTTTATITTTPPANTPPYTPHTPTPNNGATNQSIFVDLWWNGGDPDTGDMVVYDVYFGINSNPPYYGFTIQYPASQILINYTLPTLSTNTKYYWKIIAIDNHGKNTSGPTWSFTTVPAGDIQPPSKVTGLAVTDAKDGKLNLVWNSSTDNVGVDHYKIYRDTLFLVNATLTSYQDSWLVDGQSYTYQVSAVDFSGNEGQKSDNASGTPTATTSDGSTPPVTANKAPIAKPGGPYQEMVGIPIIFDGSKSLDPDGTIVKWYWTFGDGANGTGKIVTHAYIHTGLFTVNLTVTDNQGATDTKNTNVTILILNKPPENLSINGPRNGTINTSYRYIALSNDPEGQNLTYMFDWGDNSNSSIGPVRSGEETGMNHTWIAAGVYQLTVFVIDDQNASNSTSITVLISVEYVADIGYLIDHNGDGTYDSFYSNQTKNEINVEKLVNGSYLIDSTGDGKWDYMYDPKTKKLTTYHPTEEEGTPQSITLMVLGGILGIIAVLFIALLLLTRKKKTEPVPTPEQTVAEAPAAKTTGKKQTTKKSGKKPTK